MTPTKCLTSGQAEDAAIQLERDVLEIVREEIGMRDILAGPMSSAIVRGLRRKLGGRAVYVPATDTSERDARVRREFTGPASIPSIQRWSGLSRTSIYRIAGQRSAENPTLPVETGRQSR